MNAGSSTTTRVSISSGQCIISIITQIQYKVSVVSYINCALG